MADTKICPECDKEIGVSETVCPSCSTNLEELEETVAAVEKANKVLEKRRKKKEEEERAALPPTVTPPATKTTGAARLRSLGRAFRKEK